MVNKLLLEIGYCPEVSRVFTKEMHHPCSKIVRGQGIKSLNDLNIPEPWSGRIETAPILFISSNPSISDVEIFPNRNWNDNGIKDYFQNRFGGGKKDWTIKGTKSLRKDGSHGRATMFWAGVKARSKELLEREPIPGVDYALTELVHCKSRQELGVLEALDKCTSLYLEKVLTVSGAPILVGSTSP